MKIISTITAHCWLETLAATIGEWTIYAYSLYLWPMPAAIILSTMLVSALLRGIARYSRGYRLDVIKGN